MAPHDRTAGAATSFDRADTSTVDEPEPVETDLLVEEISIDGMCGVY